MELYRNLGKAFNLMWSASDNLIRGLDIGKGSTFAHRLRALRTDFHKAEEEGDQAEMLRLAREMGSFGNDLVVLKRYVPS